MDGDGRWAVTDRDVRRGAAVTCLSDPDAQTRAAIIHGRARTTVRTTVFTGLAAVLAVMGASPAVHAQERTVFEFTLPASPGSYPAQYSIDVGDTLGHAARIYEIERLFPPGVASIDDVRVLHLGGCPERATLGEPGDARIDGAIL